jgi:hypothetical protein
MLIRKKMVAVCVLFLGATSAANALMHVKYWNNSANPVILQEISRGSAQTVIAAGGKFTPANPPWIFTKLSHRLILQDGTVLSIKDTGEPCHKEWDVHALKFYVRSTVEESGTNMYYRPNWEKMACITTGLLGILNVDAIITDGGIELNQGPN